LVLLRPCYVLDLDVPHEEPIPNGLCIHSISITSSFQKLE
jgi:hypothetical protein